MSNHIENRKNGHSGIDEQRVGYEFKVGDKGRTRGGDHYEVIAFVPGAKMPLALAVGPDGSKRVCAARPCGTRAMDGRPSQFDLMPPEKTSLWPNRVVYDLRCVTDVKHIAACLKDGRMPTACGFSWPSTPQGEHWWSQRYDKPLSDETRSALEDMLAQHLFEYGERYEGGDWVLGREEIAKSIGDHDRLTYAFLWGRPPEGQCYWAVIRCNGHDWQSRVKLKVMLLSIAAESPSDDLPYPVDNCRTHWDGCWRTAGHHNCAVARADRLDKRVAQLEEILEKAGKVADAMSALALRPSSGGGNQ